MSPRRLALFSVCLPAIALSVTWGVGRSNSRSAVPAGAAAKGETQPMAMVVSEISPFAVPPADRDALPLTAVAGVAPDCAVVMAEEIALAAVAEEVGLKLTPSQLSRLAEITSCHGAIRHTYEARIARVTPLGAGRFQIQIAPYPAAGEALRNALYADVREQLGTAVAAEVVRKLASRWEKDFAGFGQADQTLEFVAREDVVPRDYTVTRTVITRRSSTELRPLVRRETYIPSIEDASGEQWGPFLAILPGDASVLAGN